MSPTRKRRVRLVVTAIIIAISMVSYRMIDSGPPVTNVSTGTSAELASMYEQASKDLQGLDVKGRAPKTGYSRAEFGDGWSSEGVCDMRNIILNRDLKNVEVSDDCKVMNGTLNDPYTGKTIKFKRGASTSADIQIDHVVALSDAWQKGAQGLSFERRVKFSNDPLNLLAVDGPANQEKSDSDAATWLPPNKAFRCQYVSRQVSVKAKYDLWVTSAEKEAIERVLGACIK